MAATRLPSTGLPESPKAPLTPREDARQVEAGNHYRALLREITGQFVDATEKHGILLSGGADSATVLVNMIEAGARPECITFRSQGVLSPDAKKAETLAKHYGLNFHVVDLPEDPDWVVNDIVEMLKEYPDLDMTRRPNIEVLHVMHYLARYAKEIGVKSIFSGLGDASIHMVGRSNEIDGRGRFIPRDEIAMKQVWNSEDDQIGPFASMCEKLGLDLCLPVTVATAMYPYLGLTWREMNVPRKKWVTLRAYESEWEAIGINIMPNPLQSGEGGTRGYFDDAARDSGLANQIAGREVTSADMLYNSIAKTRGLVKEARGGGKKHDVWEVWRHNVLGIAPTKRDWSAKYEINPDGTAKPPAIEEELGGMFGEVMEDEAEEIIRDENGNPDTRTDCFGVPFYTGDALSRCPRACAGLCGTYREDNPVVIEACQFFDMWAEEAAFSLEGVVDAYGGDDGPIRHVYAEWAARSRDKMNQMVADARVDLGYPETVERYWNPALAAVSETA